MPGTAITILYHADCPDGFGAAYAAWRRFGDTAAYRPMHHGQPWKMAEIAGHTVYILDFSFPPEMLEAMIACASSVTQIDHHASARRPWTSRLTETTDGGESYSHPALPLTVIFDLGKSGARMAWEYFHPMAPLPLILRHVEDMDMWRFAMPETRAVGRALRLLAFEFTAWHELIQDTPDPEAPRYKALVAEGEAIERFFRIEVERLAHSALVMPAHLRGEPVDSLQVRRHGLSTIGDEEYAWRAVEGLAINASVLFASEVGNLLAERSGTFGLIWQLDANGDVKCSLRSKGNFDVAEIATRYGGGGHLNAAGFRLPFARFASEILGKE